MYVMYIGYGPQLQTKLALIHGKSTPPAPWSIDQRKTDTAAI